MLQRVCPWQMVSSTLTRMVPSFSAMVGCRFGVKIGLPSFHDLGERRADAPTWREAGRQMLIAVDDADRLVPHDTGRIDLIIGYATEHFTHHGLEAHSRQVGADAAVHPQ